jgi:hypothetical protein
MKVIIAGSRAIEDYNQLLLAIKNADFVITEVISGTAHGPDRLGERWAYINKIPCTKFPPEWVIEVNGKKVKDSQAGHKRNRRMGDYADALIALWDCQSRGTEGMINYMARLNKPVYVLEVK